MTERQPEAPAIPSADALRAYLKARGWTQHLGPESVWSRDGRYVEVPGDAGPDALREVIAAIAHAEGRPEADVTVSVRSLAEAREPLVMPHDESAALRYVRQAVARTFGAIVTKPCGCGPDEPHADIPPPVAAASDPAEADTLRRGARILGSIIARNHQAMEAARIEMIQNGPHAGMQWVLNSLPDVWDDPETKWDGAESAQAWFDRTEDFYRAAKEDAELSGIRSPSAASAVPPADGTGPADGTWRERAEAAEARLAELENAVTWNTSCTSCSRVRDSAYAETVRRE